MTSLRRFYHRHFGHHERFHLAVILTILVTAYVAVPRVVQYIDALRGYAPVYYEPKDLDRQAWLRAHGFAGLSGLGGLSLDVVVDVLLFVVVAIVWLTLVPTRAARRRAPPR